MDEIIIKRIKNVSNLDEYISSTLIDIAYTKEKGINFIIVELDDRAELDLQNENDKNFLFDIFQIAFKECQEEEAEIMFELDKNNKKR